MIDSLRNALKKLRLSGLLESLEVRLQEAAGHSLSHAEFLELIVQDELVVRWIGSSSGASRPPVSGT